MPQFFSGTLDFEGDTFVVKRLAINAEAASLDAVANYNGAPWLYQAKGQLVTATPNVYLFKAPCMYFGAGKPQAPTPSEYILRIQLTYEDSELEVDGVWQEEKGLEKYTVSGLLEEVGQQQR